MYNSNKKQYIFRQSSGKVWNFYHDEKTGLCYSILTRRNTWTEPVTLQRNIFPSFFADIDYDDNFHILYQDKAGNIFYSRISDGNIINVPVLNSKQPSPYDKHFYLIPSKSVIHLFFTIHYNDACILSHQTVTGSTASRPRVIDYILRNELPYTVIYDRPGNFYALYQSSDGKYLQTGYKKYTSAQNFWGEFIPVTKFNGDTEFPRAIIDNKDIIHLCYQRRGERQYEMVYQQKVPDKNLWTGEIVIHSSASPFTDSSIVWTNDTLYIFWVRSDVVYFSSSNDKGSTWTKPSKLNFSAGRQLLCMCYKSNSPNEGDKFIAREIPGNFINGFKLAFYEAASEGGSNLSPDELKNMIVDSLRLLKVSIEELKEANTHTRENIAQLNLNQQNLEREITKCSLRIGLLENEFNQIKAINRQLESYRNSLYQQKTEVEQISNGSGKPDEGSMYQDIMTHQNIAGTDLRISRPTQSQPLRNFTLTSRTSSRRFTKKGLNQGK